MSVVHTSGLRFENHESPHWTAHIEGFPELVHFGIHSSRTSLEKRRPQRKVRRTRKDRTHEASSGR
jgi:hypothetical protein